MIYSNSRYNKFVEELKQFKKRALVQYEDLRDTVAVIEAMHLQGSKPGASWNHLKNKLRAKHN